ncbi:MAG: hypothetical protein HC840_01235 [Leptolyngbyaceae cyanobacterium RM2_2_4]|nr:hypothetical protein [Leptolyngbyaceae cyanobacterium RM2_2_4]
MKTGTGLSLLDALLNTGASVYQHTIGSKGLGAVGTKIGEGIADYIGEEDLVKGLAYAKQMRENQAAKFGEQARDPSGMDIILGSLANLTNETGVGWMGAPIDAALHGAEMLHQTKKANAEPNLYGNGILQQLIGTIAQFLPETTGEIGAQAALAGVGGVGLGVGALKNANPILTKPLTTGHAGRIGQLKAAGLSPQAAKVLWNNPKQVTNLFNKHGTPVPKVPTSTPASSMSVNQAVRQAKQVIRSPKTPKAPKSPNAPKSPKASSSATSPTKTATSKKWPWLAGLGTAGVGGGLYMAGRASGVDAIPEKTISLSEPLAGASRAQPTSASIAQPTGAINPGNVGASASSNVGANQLLPLIQYLQQLKAAEAQGQQKNFLQRAGNVLTNTGVAWAGGDPRLTQRQLDLPNRTPEQQAMFNIEPALLMYLAQSGIISPMDAAAIEELKSRTQSNQAFTDWTRKHNIQ